MKSSQGDLDKQIRACHFTLLKLKTILLLLIVLKQMPKVPTQTLGASLDHESLSGALISLSHPVRAPSPHSFCHGTFVILLYLEQRGQTVSVHVNVCSNTTFIHWNILINILQEFMFTGYTHILFLV